MLSRNTAEKVFGPYIGMRFRAINVEEGGSRVELWFADDGGDRVHLLTFWNEAAGIGTGYNHGGWIGNPDQTVEAVESEGKSEPNAFIAHRLPVAE